MWHAALFVASWMTVGGAAALALQRDGRHAYVLVLGDPQGAADALAVLRDVDDVGEVTLVGLIDFESAQRPTWDETKAPATSGRD